MPGAAVLVASNRGPVTHRLDGDGRLLTTRGGGGLVSALSALPPAMTADVTWVCAALSDGDRHVARERDGRLVVDGRPVQMLDLDRVMFDRAYNAVANRTLWFVSHLLYDTPTSPVFGPVWRRDWTAYEHYNAAFADALAARAAPDGRVLVQDYHLWRLPRLLQERRPDLRIGHFTHIPWAPVDYYRLLPDEVGEALLRGLLGADWLGFHDRRWADAFRACCEALLGAELSDDGVWLDGRHTTVAVLPLGVDAEALRRRAQEPDVQARVELLREQLGGCRLVLRVDRTEPSKNIVRGLLAYRELLAARPELHGDVVHLACAYPSRHDLPEYREYTGLVQRTAADVITEFARPGWEPLRLEVGDDYARSLAAYTLADVLVVNPLRDGMNLVAKEVPLLSQRDVAVVLSREAGAASELAEGALLVNPYDVNQTAERMSEALELPAAQRAAAVERFSAAARALPPGEWLARQLTALD